MVTFLSTVVAGGALYMKKSFRDLLTDNFPDSKHILDQVETWIGGWYNEQQPKKVEATVDDFPAPMFHEKVHEEDVGADPSSAPTYSKKSQTTELPTLEDVKQMTRERSKAIVADVTASIHECLSDAQRAVKSASLSLGDLEAATRNYIEGLRVAIKSGGSGSTQDKKWNHVSKLASLEDKAKTKANAAVDQARDALDRLHSTINHYRLHEESPEYQVLPEGISAFGKLQYDLSGALHEVSKLQNELQLLMRYRDLASKTHETLQNDLDSIYKETAKASKDGPSLTADELNALVAAAHKRIEKLQGMLSVVEEKERARLNSALEAQRRADEELIADYVKRELDLERSKHELERYHWRQEAREATDRELRQALARHGEHLTHMLRLKEEEKEHQFAIRVRERLAQEKQAFEAALTGWIARMRAIEDVIDGRAELDRIAKETQALWIACEALACSLSAAFPTGSDKIARTVSGNTTGPLNDFIEPIRELAATGRYPFVSDVLAEIPDEAIDHGVWHERSLKERFEKVYKVCRRVALVDETGGSLYTYALSWIQSMLIFDYSPHEYLPSLSWLTTDTFVPVLKSDSDLQTDTEVDTFLLLRSAKAALLTPSPAAEGDNCEDGIELAVRLLGQLRGQARLVASDWLEDARRYLEAKQAAQALLAYATARGMSTFQTRL